MTTDTTTTTAPDHEALLTTVEATVAALIAALEACVAAGLPVGSVEDVRRAADTSGTRAWLVEQARPKGPMLTIEHPKEWTKDVSTSQAEVAHITKARIVLRDGRQFSRETGYRVGPNSRRTTTRITPDEIARIVATGWTPPKAPRASKAAK